MRAELQGWFATSFWVDCHYGLAAIGTVAVIATYILTQKFDLGFAGFVTGLWATATANDKVNMPTVSPPPRA